MRLGSLRWTDLGFLFPARCSVTSEDPKLAALREANQGCKLSLAQGAYAAMSRELLKSARWQASFTRPSSACQWQQHGVYMPVDAHRGRPSRTVLHVATRR